MKINNCLGCQREVIKAKWCGRCRRRLKEHGDVSTVLPKYRKYFFNQEFFNIITPESSWVLGWLFTDGNINTDRMRVSWGITDKEILMKFKELFKYDGPIKERIGSKINHKNHYHLRLTSKILHNSCIRLGLSDNKTFNLRFPKELEHYKYHFLRGAIEGDGSIVYRNKTNKYGIVSSTINVSIVSGSKKFLEDINKIIHIKGTIFARTKDRKNPLYVLYWSSKKASQICELIYKDSENFRLDRKYQKYLSYKAFRETWKPSKTGPKIGWKLKKKEFSNGPI